MYRHELDNFIFNFGEQGFGCLVWKWHPFIWILRPIVFSFSLKEILDNQKQAIFFFILKKMALLNFTILFYLSFQLGLNNLSFRDVDE